MECDDRSGSARKRVLIIDDDEDYRSSLSEILCHAGYDVLAVENGEQGLSVLESQRPLPEALVLDLLMPKMNGWQLFDRISVNPELKKIPVIVVTGSGLTQGAMGKTPMLTKSGRFAEEVVRRLGSLLTQDAARA